MINRAWNRSASFRFTQWLKKGHITKDQLMSVLPADPMADVFFGTSADVRSDPMFSVDINNALKNATRVDIPLNAAISIDVCIICGRPQPENWDTAHGRNLLHECTRVPVPLTLSIRVGISAE